MKIIQLTKSLRTYVYNSIEQASNEIKLSKEDIEDSIICLTETELGYFMRANSVIMLSEDEHIRSVYKSARQASNYTNIPHSAIKKSCENGTTVCSVRFIKIESLL